MANELRSTRVPAPPSIPEAATAQWMRDVTNALNNLPVSIFSTSGGPNASAVTAPQGFFGIEIGSSATKHWLKTSGSTSTGWSPVNYAMPVPSSGTWIPTLNNTTNISASSAYVGQWLRVGNVVTASGAVDVDPTTADIATSLGMTLPVASDFAHFSQLGGVAFSPGIAGLGAALQADITNNRVTIAWVPSSNANNTYQFSFNYLVV